MLVVGTIINLLVALTLRHFIGNAHFVKQLSSVVNAPHVCVLFIGKLSAIVQLWLRKYMSIEQYEEERHRVSTSNNNNVVNY